MTLDFGLPSEMHLLYQSLDHSTSGLTTSPHALGRIGSDDQTLQTTIGRSPSPPPLGEDVEQQKQHCWSTEAHRAFQARIEAPGYINRQRVNAFKRHRMMQYLQDPGLEPLLDNGKRDHQTRYQAASHTLLADHAGHLHLHRKPEFGRASHLRRHLDETDKFRKVLETKYIGYTLQEIMFVLAERVPEVQW